MKIQDAITENKAYWTERIKSLEKRLAAHQVEVQSLAAQLTEAQQQIVLYDKAAEILITLDQQQVNTIDVEVKT